MRTWHDKNIQLCVFCSEENEESRGVLEKIILRNWNLFQANNGFYVDIESW